MLADFMFLWGLRQPEIRQGFLDVFLSPRHELGAAALLTLDPHLKIRALVRRALAA
jgi:hypothetical protein